MLDVSVPGHFGSYMYQSYFDTFTDTEICQKPGYDFEFLLKSVMPAYCTTHTQDSTIYIAFVSKYSIQMWKTSSRGAKMTRDRSSE
jgi:hypothetical protein